LWQRHLLCFIYSGLRLILEPWNVKGIFHLYTHKVLVFIIEIPSFPTCYCFPRWHGENREWGLLQLNRRLPCPHGEALSYSWKLGGMEFDEMGRYKGHTREIEAMIKSSWAPNYLPYFPFLWWKIVHVVVGCKTKQKTKLTLTFSKLA